MVQVNNPTGPLSVEPLSPTNIQYQQTDPAFAKLVQTMNDCLTHYNSILEKMSATPKMYASIEDIDRQDFCTNIINQGLAQFCESTDFATFDIAKCEEARNMTSTYLAVAEGLFG